MAGRRARAGAERRPRRRWGVFSLAALAVLGVAAWIAPAVLVHTSLRDRPLEAAFAGIDGSIASAAARWHWLSGIEYRDVVLRDAGGRPAVIVRSLLIEKGILGLVIDPRQLGTVRLAGVEAAVAVRPGGSSLEDILAPWLAAPRNAGGVTCDLELVGGTVEFSDTRRTDVWRLADLFAAGRLLPEGGFADWTVGGRLRHAGGTAAAPQTEPVARPVEEPGRLDRTTIPAAAAAVLARDGGWTVSALAGTARSIAVTAHRLPLGGSSVLATRLGIGRVLDGLADVRLDLTLAGERSEARGRIAVERLAVCRADTLAEEFGVERCELPLHLSMTGAEIVAHELRFSSPVARGEVSGRLAWPGDDAWRWLEDCVGRDCSLAAEVDLAAAALALPGGLVVRPEVQLTGGQLRLAAVARGDGADRILELRAEARDLAALRTERAGDEATARPLRWTEPFTGWVRARRGPIGGAALRIEEGRLASTTAEVSATGSPAALRVEWTADLGGIAGDLGEVLDLGGTTLAGTCRGRVDVERGAGGLSTGTLAASIADFELATPGRPAWQDESIILDAEATWSLAAGVAAIETGRGMITARADSLEATLAGGALVDVAALTGSGGVAIRPARSGAGVAAECSLQGDLGRWQRRLAVVLPILGAPGLELAGTVQAAAAVAAEPASGGDAWRITKAGGEIDRFELGMGGIRVSEPRVVATAAGTLLPAARRFEISSAELLTSTLSLRSGGVSWSPSAAREGLLDAVLAGLRGRVQWQADLTRFGRWLVAAEVADRWPVSGRAWGTLDVAETQTGLNLLVEATGSQLAIGTRPAGSERPAPARPVWNEPQASLALEVTRPFVRAAGGGLAAADRLVVDRFALESSTLAVAARGNVGDWSGLRQATLEGTVAYDWEQLSRLAAPWTAGKIRVTGAGERPFTIRAALGEKAAPPSGAEAAPATAGALPLPEEWLAAVQAGAGEPVVVSPPVQATASPASDRISRASSGLARRLREVSLDTSAAWAAADIDGFSLASGDVAVRLVEGQLAFGPFDVAAAGGRLRGAPWIRLDPLPGELVVPPGRVVERVALSGDLCGRFVSLISPVLAGTTRTSGLLSVDLAGGRLPLGDPPAGEAAGQVLLEQFEVQPSGAMQPLVALLARLQAVVDPRFALGDKVVLLRVRPEPIRVRLAERRLWHEGLMLDFGQLAVSSRGSVGEDGSLAALVEVAFRGDVAGQTPVVATLLRTPIAIPLKGTLARPQFDAGAIDVVVKRIVENTARAVLDDGIGRGLEAVFGSPPAVPAPLTLPR